MKKCFGTLAVSGRAHAIGLAAALVSLSLPSFDVAAQLAVSANDNKVINVNGVNQIVQNPPPDTVTIIDLGVSPPKVVGEVNAPSSVVGPPQNVAIAPDGSYAAVTIQNGSQRPKSHQAFNDFGSVKVFRINGTKLTLAAEAKVGHWGQGVAWSRDGRTLVVQSMIEKELEILNFDGRELKKTGAIKVNGGPAGLGTAQR